jgi:rhodanese-related sulfurtransferase/DNA-binding transcriptional ArsR family regulator
MHSTTKTSLNEQFARIGKALSSPRRIELLDLLAQGERSVEALAAETGMSVALASSHLAVLRATRLVDARRDRSYVRFRLADEDVHALLCALRDVARSQLAEVQQIVAGFLEDPRRLEPVLRTELWARAEAGDVTVLDVRPRPEYEAGHIPGALSIPIDELDTRLGELPAHVDVVAYCRGPFCLYAPEAIAKLRGAGIGARRLEEGYPEWRRAGLPVVVGPVP